VASSTPQSVSIKTLFFVILKFPVLPEGEIKKKSFPAGETPGVPDIYSRDRIRLFSSSAPEPEGWKSVPVIS